MKLLVLSNGHGEDVIAVKIIEQLRQLQPSFSIACLPLVGCGHAYAASDVPAIAPVKAMPSGGFIYMEARQLWRDLRGGLLPLTLAQYRAVSNWGKAGGAILAVGDILPLLLAWWSGANYAFVGTAKSEYYLRDEGGWLPESSWLERRFGSIYYPWERWLMERPRCRGVFPRDGLTAATLQSYGIEALNLGNPMMDGLSPASGDLATRSRESDRPPVILLLPGSRLPEAADNWHLLLEAVDSVIESSSSPAIFLGAIAPAIELEGFREGLNLNHWQVAPPPSGDFLREDPEKLSFTKGASRLYLTQNAYEVALHRADLAIAMAGTATEQFVGLGKPAIAMAGKGPQYTLQFARNQTRLLGVSLQLVQTPQQVAGKIKQLLKSSDLLESIRENGQKRMGTAGAARRIAIYLKEKLIES